MVLVDASDSETPEHNPQCRKIFDNVLTIPLQMTVQFIVTASTLYGQECAFGFTQ